jgi:L-ascorbate metabolism protein UlaG (beta-lactamase superfamily)
VIPAERNHDGMKITYIGHATVLIQIDGLNIITDPVFSLRASPFRFIGPKRFTDPGVKIEDLPPIDIILLSHNHYDHMDIESLRIIEKNHNAPIYT